MSRSIGSPRVGLAGASEANVSLRLGEPRARPRVLEVRRPRMSEEESSCTAVSMWSSSEDTMDLMFTAETMLEEEDEPLFANFKDKDERKKKREKQHNENIRQLWEEYIEGFDISGIRELRPKEKREVVEEKKQHLFHGTKRREPRRLEGAEVAVHMLKTMRKDSAVQTDESLSVESKTEILKEGQLKRNENVSIPVGIPAQFESVPRRHEPIATISSADLPTRQALFTHRNKPTVEGLSTCSNVFPRGMARNELSPQFQSLVSSLPAVVDVVVQAESEQPKPETKEVVVDPPKPVLEEEKLKKAEEMENEEQVEMEEEEEIEAEQQEEQEEEEEEQQEEDDKLSEDSLAQSYRLDRVDVGELLASVDNSSQGQELPMPSWIKEELKQESSESEAPKELDRCKELLSHLVDATFTDGVDLDDGETIAALRRAAGRVDALLKDKEEQDSPSPVASPSPSEVLFHQQVLEQEEQE